MANQKSNAELRVENRLLRRGNTAMAVTSIFNNVIRWGSVVLIVRYMYLSVASLAGQETIANVMISFLANLTVSQSLAYIFGGGAIIYGVAERRIRQRTIKRLQGRVQQLEIVQDPRRTSSNLTERGETHPQDRE